MYRFALRPIWLAGHVLAGGLLVIFVLAGFWQFSRHGEVRDRNAAAAGREQMQPLDAAEFFAAAHDPELADKLEYRSATLPLARIEWQDGVLIRNRSLGGTPGCHLALPVATAPTDGTRSYGVLVVAGWLNAGLCDPATTVGSDAFRGGLAETALITGRIRPSQQRGALGPIDPAEGRLASLARTDVARIDQQSSLKLMPMYVELTSAARADGTPIGLGDNLSGTGLSSLLAPLPPPELDAGPHLGYTIQWFSFAVVAIIGYALVLRHQARKGESEFVADD